VHKLRDHAGTSTVIRRDAATAWSIHGLGSPVVLCRFRRQRRLRAAGRRGSGFVTLSVRSFDRAFNVSPVTSYRVIIANTAPTVTGTADPVVGVPFQVAFAPAPNTGTVNDYVYTVNGGPEQTVPAATDGTASVEVAAAQPGSLQIDVYSRSANGWVSPKAHAFISVTAAG
jgi:hypothetical protein